MSPKEALEPVSRLDKDGEPADAVGHPQKFVLLSEGEKGRSKHKGAQSELVATIWLMDHGYEVFRAVSPFGEVDIIARHPKTRSFIEIDVKSVTAQLITRSDGSVIRFWNATATTVENGVRRLFVYGDGIVSWRRRRAVMVEPATRAPARNVKQFGRVLPLGCSGFEGEDYGVGEEEELAG